MINLENIYNCKNPHQLVVAAAGTGKTFTLIHALHNRIKLDYFNPLSEKDKVIVFTFTNNAADELAVRLSELMGSEEQLLNNIFIGTIHSWCNEYLDYKGTLANTKIIDELQRMQLLQRLYPILSINRIYDGNNKFTKISKFIKDIEFFYNENLDITDNRIPKNIRILLEDYLNILSQQRLMDFGYLIKESIKIISNSDEEKINYHIFIDEYQDVNPAQVQLIQSILNKYPGSTLFAVGDPRQAIYQWRGGDVNRILKFSQDFNNPEIFNLTQNRRSRNGIIKFANIISQDMDISSDYVIENMISHPSREDNKISVICNNVSSDQPIDIIQTIDNLKDEGIDYSDIAILMRSVVNTRGKHLMDLLNENGIPFYSPNKNSGIQFIDNFMIPIIELIEIMANDKSVQNRDQEIELQNRINSYLNSIKSYCYRSSVEKIHLAVAEWYNILFKNDRNNRYKNEQYNFRRQLFNFCNKVNFKIHQNEIEIQEGFSAITQIMRSIEEIYRRRLLNIRNIRSSPIDVFVHNLKWQLKDQIERWTKIGMNLKDTKKLTVSTVHAAKGLQWPVVLVPYLIDGKFPLNPSNHDTSFPDEIAYRYGTTIEDEKRLWYVAATRARDRLYFFSGGSDTKETSTFSYLADIKKEDKHICILSDLNKNLEMSEVEHFIAEKYYNIGLSNFLILLECLFQFHLRYIIGIDVPVGPEFGAGNITHKVIHRLSRSEDKESFKKIIDEEVYLPLGEFEDEIKNKKSTEKKIQRLIKSNLLDSIDLTEYPFSMRIKNFLVKGIIDATRKTDRGFEIIDWKSSVHDDLKHRYENQIRLYAYGLNLLGYKVSKGTIYDLSQEDLVSSSLDIDISDGKVKDLLKLATNVVRNMQKKESEICPNKVSCIACDVKEICPYSLLEKNEMKK